VPGIHFVHTDANRKLPENIEQKLDRFRHDDYYQSRVVYRDENVVLAVTDHPKYPVSVISTSCYLILLEGFISGLSGREAEKHLLTLAEAIFDEGREDDSIREWLLLHGGDYVLVMHEKKSGRWVCLNDVLARLPLYFYSNRGLTCLSREIRVLADIAGLSEMDRIGLAQYLLFGFPLGSRTILEGVDRLPPATLLTCSRTKKEELRRSLFIFNFDNKRSSDNLEDEAEYLARLFIDACGDLIKSFPGSTPVLSLSGGLDSRTVAAGMKHAGIECHGVTYEDALGTAARDVVYAEQLAQKLNIGWKKISLSKPTVKDIIRLVGCRGGMNSTAMAFYVPFLEEIRGIYGGDILYLTGDGGDKTLPKMRPSRRISSADALTRYLVDRHDIMSVESVTELLGVSADDIRQSIFECITKYPENDFGNSYVHFMIYERGIKWLFEGEDRNRCFVPAATPFYSLGFFREAMSCPDRYKKNHRLYGEFLKILSAEAAALIDMNRMAPVDSGRYRRKEAVFNWFSRYPGFSRRLKYRLAAPPSYDRNSSAVIYVDEMADQSGCIKEIFDIARLKAICQSPGNISRTAFDNLLTLVNASILYGEGKQTLEAYTEREFNE